MYWENEFKIIYIGCCEENLLIIINFLEYGRGRLEIN